MTLQHLAAPRPSLASAGSIEHALAAPWYRLAFPREMERDFVSDTREERARHFWRMSLVGIALFVGFLLSDARLVPDVFELALLLRGGYAAITLTCLVLVSLTRTPTWVREAACQLFVVLGVAIIVTLFVSTKSPDKVAYLNGLVLVILFGNLCVSAPFPYLAVGNGCSMAAVAVGVALSDISPGGRDIYILVNTVASILTLVTMYRLERQQRFAYLRRRLDALKRAWESEQARAETSQALRRQAELEHIATLSSVSTAFEARMQHAVEKVLVVADSLCTQAQQASEIAAAAEQESTQAAIVAGTAAALTDTVASAAAALVESIGGVQRKSGQAGAAVADAVARVHQSHAALAALTESARRIETVVGLIGAIAGQTKLLSFNATIEAARVGAAGAGFAVVASEVKRLASQTSAATNDVAGIVAGMQAAMAEMVRVSDAVQHSVGSAHALTISIAEAMAAQSTATVEIAQTAQTVATDTRHSSARTSGAADHARQTATSARAILGEATGLEREAQALQGEASEFVVQLRAV